MAPLVKRHRGERGSRKLDMSVVREAVRDRRFWVGLGIVFLPDGQDTHWEIDPDVGVLVDVLLMPDQEPLLCRLSGFGQGGSAGCWRVPPVGSEVAVGFPGGEINNDPMLLTVLASGGVPDELDEDTYVVKAPKIVIIADGAVEIGQKGLAVTDGLVHGTGVDTFTGATYYALGSTSSVVSAKK